MSKHLTVALYIRLPPQTKSRAEEMARDDAAPRKGTLTEWIGDMIEAEWRRRHPEPSAMKKGNR